MSLERKALSRLNPYPSKLLRQESGFPAGNAQQVPNEGGCARYAGLQEPPAPPLTPASLLGARLGLEMGRNPKGKGNCAKAVE